MNKPNDSSRHDFWDVRFEAGRTPWDFHGVPAMLRQFLKTNAPAGKVLIPGCGRGYEVRAFHEAGWKVTAIDFSPQAVKKARIELGRLSRFVILGDFFKNNLGEQRFDLIYERTFLCALPPHLWLACVKRMAQLLRPNGRLVGLFVYGEPSDSPPYPLSQVEADALFAADFCLLKSLPVEDSLPLFAGMERWQEWRLKANNR